MGGDAPVGPVPNYHRHPPPPPHRPPGPALAGFFSLVPDYSLAFRSDATSQMPGFWAGVTEILTDDKHGQSRSGCARRRHRRASVSAAYRGARTQQKPAARQDRPSNRAAATEERRDDFRDYGADGLAPAYGPGLHGRRDGINILRVQFNAIADALGDFRSGRVVPDPRNGL